METVIARDRYDRADLLLCKLGILPALGDAQNASGRGNLYEIGAVLVTLAHRLGRLQRTIGDSVNRPRLTTEMGRPAVGGVRVTTGCGNRLAGREDAGARHRPFVHRVAQRDGHVEAVARVTHRRETGHQRLSRIGDRLDGQIGRIQTEFVEIRGL